MADGQSHREQPVPVWPSAISPLPFAKQARSTSGEVASLSRWSGWVRIPHGSITYWRMAYGRWLLARVTERATYSGLAISHSPSAISHRPGCRGAAPHLLWEQGTVGSSPTIPTDRHRPLFARSSNGSGHCSDKAETKVRLLPGRLGGKLSAISCQPEQIGQDDNTRRTLTCSFSIASNAPRPQRGRGVTAAQRAFNSHGEGSNPSGLTESGAWSRET